MAGLVAGLFLLAACQGTGVNLGGGAAPTPGSQPVTGEVLGNGSVRVALLVPLSANGNAAQIAANLRNAAALALQELPSANIQILVKDDRGTAEGARAAASEAIAQGAELILGPLFAQSVSGAASVARPAGVPIVAFSTDVSVASPGVYLLSFLPRSDVIRIIAYAAARGQSSIAALIPNNAYGTVVEGALREAAGSTGIRLVAVERYELDRTSMQEKAEIIAGIVSAGQADTVFMPDAGDAAPFLSQILAARGVRPGAVQFIGSGQWNDDRILMEPTLVGAWFPGADEAAFDAFSARYAAAYGAVPFRTASQGYDAVILAAGLTARFGESRFAAATLTDPNGFRGMDGAFRFLSDGSNQRTLAVYQITGGGGRTTIDPAPSSFAAQTATR
ncbi:MAG: penicillin-binding protein activator [Bauldia sp.]|nr:penicillin-binding protein activator [Bauldia sp.]